MTNEKEELPLCECGCRLRVTKPGNRYINGHNGRGKPGRSPSPETKKLLSIIATKQWAPQKVRNDQSKRLIQYHKDHPEIGDEMSKRMIQYYIDNPEAKNEMSEIMIQWNKDHPEAGKAHSEWMKEICSDPEVLGAMSERTIEQFSDPEAREAARLKALQFYAKIGDPGKQIVRHHFIYDHNNPDQHTVEITRAEHASHHAWMRRNGLEVPRVNAKGK